MVSGCRLCAESRSYETQAPSSLLGVSGLRPWTPPDRGLRCLVLTYNEIYSVMQAALPAVLGFSQNGFLKGLFWAGFWPLKDGIHLFFKASLLFMLLLFSFLLSSCV